MMLPRIFLDSVSSPEALAVPAGGADKDSEKRLRELASLPVDARMEAVLSHPAGRRIGGVIHGHSPFLSLLMRQYPHIFADGCILGPHSVLASIMAALRTHTPASVTELMKTLRVAKAQASLLIAVGDISGAWNLEQVTEAMSSLAELAVKQAVLFHLRESARKGLVTLPDPAEPEKGSGLFVLAMGKLGARELNYSSDIDLIVFFDREKANRLTEQNAERFFSRLVSDVVRTLQERTADGYVFRVDLRLRPDPSSTPVALSTAGALTYYETVGQNWERAAFTKARPVAGDMEAGYGFLRQLAPFLWRKHLDFAAIDDILSIKRQMDAKTGGAIRLSGHNVKTGLGGIREIEFFAQLHQLIWGGRLQALRINGTCKTLRTLATEGLITAQTAESLTESYRFLRKVEHRLQMVDDQQTHSIPTEPLAQASLAGFMEFATPEVFEAALLEHLTRVHATFSSTFKGPASLGEGGTLSFTGVENNPQTLQTIAAMGYRNPASVSEIIQGWHRGVPRATRSQRARELITELTPALLKAFAANASADQAFMHFDAFLSGLPSGVQIFSLFNANPQLLDLIAVIMGSAPAMAENLSKSPHLLDTVLTADFAGSLPSREALYDELVGLLLHARDLEDEIGIVCRFKNERQFQAGVHLLRRQSTSQEASRALSDIADICLEMLLHRVEMSFYGEPHSPHLGQFTILALGRLGARQMTFGSDIDLLFLYDGDTVNHSRFNKLAQRVISALTLLTREGRLYEVDTRLRPFGKDGALAVSLEAFEQYITDSAWTFELMAYTRSRVIGGNAAVRAKTEALLARQLRRPRDAAKLAEDIRILRGKITREFGSDEPWNLKYAHGGILDLNFAQQFLLLSHAHAYPQLLNSDFSTLWKQLAGYGIVPPDTARTLRESQFFLDALLSMQRLYASPLQTTMPANPSVLHNVAVAMGCADARELKAKLLATLERTRNCISPILGSSQGV